MTLDKKGRVTLCAACGEAPDLSEHQLGPALPDGTPAPSVLLCEACRERLRAHQSFYTRQGIRKAQERGVKFGGYRGAPLTLDAALRGSRHALAARQAKAEQHAADVLRSVEVLRASSAETLSLRQLAEGLNDMKVLAPRGGAWQPTTVRRVLQRVEGTGGN